MDLYGEDNELDVAGALPEGQMNIDPQDEPGPAQGNDNAQNNRPVHAQNLSCIEDIIAECEVKLKRYLKRQRLERGSKGRGAAADYNYLINDDQADNGSVSSSSESIFIDYNEQPPGYVPVTRADWNRKKQRLIIGSWVLLSYTEGGWDYENTKNYMKTEFGVKCLNRRYMPDSQSMEGEYKAVIKFRSSEDLNRVITSLDERNIRDKFLFSSFDKMAVVYYDSDSDDDDSSSGSLIPSPLDF